MRAVRRNPGFTLVELLVAIALLGMLGVIAWRGLDYVAAQRERVESEALALEHVLRVLSQIDRDVERRAPEALLPVASAAASLLPASLSAWAERGAVALEVVRLAPAAAGPVRLQRVVYRIADGALARSTSAPSDAWPLPEPRDAVTLLPGARRLAVRAYVGGFWTELGTGENVLPRARATGIDIEFEDAQGARYRRVFSL